jgi:hypothetical protein
MEEIGIKADIAFESASGQVIMHPSAPQVISAKQL